MKKRKLGRTDLHVSELNLNTDKFGWLADEAESFAVLDAYYTCGGSFIQTVGPAPNSVTAEFTQTSSEDTVGRWRETRGISREGLVLASRINFFRPHPGGSIAFANHIREACERSLRRLRTTHLDLLICEWDEDLHPVDDVLEGSRPRRDSARNRRGSNDPPTLGRRFPHATAELERRVRPRLEE